MQSGLNGQLAAIRMATVSCLFIQSNPYTQPADIARLFDQGSIIQEQREEFTHLMAMPSLWMCGAFYSIAGLVSQDASQKYIERQSKSKC